MYYQALQEAMLLKDDELSSQIKAQEAVIRKIEEDFAEKAFPLQRIFVLFCFPEHPRLTANHAVERSLLHCAGRSNA